MPKLTLTDIASGYASITELNQNFTAIETAIENTVSRDGTTPNQMTADLDMNGNDILNTASVSTGSLYIGGALVTATSSVNVLEEAQTGGFWVDETIVPNINRVADRLFVDDAVQFVGNWAGTDNDYSPIPRWPSREASLLVWSSVGRNAIVGLSKTSLGVTDPGGTPTSADSAIGVIGIAINDYVGADNRNAFGGYFESWKGSGSIKAAFGVEIDVGNDSATDQTNTPFSPFGAGTFGLNISAGGSKGSAYANPSSCAIVIGNNTSTFNTGIVVGATAITGTDGVTGTGAAIRMAKGHVLSWEIAAGTTTNLYSSISDVAYKKTLEFHNTHARFLGASNNINFAVEDVASSVNYPSAIPSITGVATQLKASGSDTNIDLLLAGKGTGVVSFGAWTSNADAAVNGYVTIKDAAGNTRKLATIA